MNWKIEGFSNHRLEAEISRIYWDAHLEAPGVRIQETGVLAALWSEFDRRWDSGLIEKDPLTGNEVDND